MFPANPNTAAPWVFRLGIIVSRESDTMPALTAEVAAVTWAFVAAFAVGELRFVATVAAAVVSELANADDQVKADAGFVGMLPTGAFRFVAIVAASVLLQLDAKAGFVGINPTGALRFVAIVAANVEENRTGPAVLPAHSMLLTLGMAATIRNSSTTATPGTLLTVAATLTCTTSPTE